VAIAQSAQAGGFRQKYEISDTTPLIIWLQMKLTAVRPTFNDVCACARRAHPPEGDCANLALRCSNLFSDPIAQQQTDAAGFVKRSAQCVGG
jgi:hypothetical protein